MDYTAHYPSPLGDILLASDGTALTGLWLDGQRHSAATLDPQHEERPTLPLFDEVRCWLDTYFSGCNPDFLPPLAPRGTPFRQSVWRLLMDIPYGQTVTYGEIARRLHCRSAQAVGTAIGHNPISIIIPCHRVLPSDGTLGGYAAGPSRKQFLLHLENPAHN
ncbi:MAG: methylated-DNA--[protein]-cysteine S-methyltransferase [Bacteroidales bacterium]|nr:methylated-DNA--[protein]-cysteine S-methyltransferase [Bacteroidales bacterium]